MVVTTPRGNSMALTAAGNFAVTTGSLSARSGRSGGDMQPVLGPGGAPFETTLPRWKLEKATAQRYPEAMPTVIFITGPPGSGKTEQSERIAKKFHYVHLHAKDLLLEESLREGSECARYIEAGKAVPPELFMDVLKRALQSDWKFGKFIVDDFPFDMAHFEAFFKLLKEKVNFKYCLYMDCNEANLAKGLRETSLARNGFEDSADAINQQVASFREVAAEVIAFLRYEGCFERIDANRDADKIWAEVQRVFIIEEHQDSMATEKIENTPMRAVWKLRDKQSEDIFPREHSHLNQSNVKDAHARHFTSYTILTRHRDKHTRNMRSPVDNFHEPMTLSQEIGWHSSSCAGGEAIGAKGIPVGGSTPRMFHPKNTCAMTRHMENMYSTNAQHIIRRW